MQWVDEGIILSIRKYGENAAIAEIFTQNHGRTLGLVQRGRTHRLRALLQPGNLVKVVWRARLEEQLGNFTLDATQFRVGSLIDDPFKLAGLIVLTELARLLPEREPNPHLYHGLCLLLDALDEDVLWPALLVCWELELLKQLGFGLDLSQCAVTGQSAPLHYVSPRTGRAVIKSVGEAYHDRLLPLPQFLSGSTQMSRSDLLDGFRLTSFFLNRHIFHPRGINAPEQRDWIIAHLSTDQPPEYSSQIML